MSNTSLLGSFGGQAGDALMFRNRIINGDMRIAQRGNVALANNTIAYGGCDRTFVVPTGFTTATGTALQGTFTGSTSGKGQFAASLTTTGTGKVFFVQRIESQNVNDLNGQNVTFSGKIAHDIGTTQSVLIRVVKANALDSFGTVTTVLQQTVSVPSGVTTSFTLTALLGATDANNGLGVEIEFNLGAISNKNIGVSDLQLEAGPTATPFERRPIGVETALAQRYYYRFTGRGGVSEHVVSGTTTTGSVFWSVNLPVTMRINPFVNHTLTDASYSGSGPSANQWTFGHSNVSWVTKTGTFIISAHAYFDVIGLGISNVTYSLIPNSISLGTSMYIEALAEL